MMTDEPILPDDAQVWMGIARMRSAHAHSVAKAQREGKPWTCARVQQVVTVEQCLEYYARELAYNPCRECSIIARHIQEHDVQKDKKLAPVLTKYEPDLFDKRGGMGLSPFVRFNTKDLIFSVSACEDLGVAKADTLTLYFSGQAGALERLVVVLGKGNLPVKQLNRRSKRVSIRPLMLKMDLGYLIWSRYPLEKLDDNSLEVRLDQGQKSK